MLSSSGEPLDALYPFFNNDRKFSVVRLHLLRDTLASAMKSSIEGAWSGSFTQDGMSYNGVWWRGLKIGSGPASFTTQPGWKDQWRLSRCGRHGNGSCEVPWYPTLESMKPIQGWGTRRLWRG